MTAPARTTTRRGYLAVTLTASGGTFLAMLDSTVTNLAVPNLQDDFPTATVADLSWVISAYVVMFAALLAAAGRLADVLGRRRLFLLGMGLFTVSSLLCAVAPSLAVLVIVRFLQGAGAAVMIPASLAVLLLDGPADRRAASLGIWSATSAFAAAVGPTVGGVLVEAFGWRSVFIINVPVGILLLVAAARLLDAEPGKIRGRVPDPLGTLMLVLGIGLLTLGLTEAGTWGWLTVKTIGCFVVGLVAIVLVIVRSRRHVLPVLEISLWSNHTFGAANAVSFLYGLAQYPWLLVSVLYLTDIWRYDELQAGLAMTPGAIVASVAALGLGRLAPRMGGPRTATLVGFVAFAACGVWFLLALPEQPAFLALWLPASALVGLGMGAATVGTTSAAAMSSPPTKFASSSGLNTTARQFGGALGIAVLALILQLGTRPDGSRGYDAYLQVFGFSTGIALLALITAAIWLRFAAPAPAPKEA